MEQEYLEFTPKRKSIVWNYQDDGTARVTAILTDKLMKTLEVTPDYNKDTNGLGVGGICINLNLTGTKIWEQCDGINTVEDILDILLQDFNIQKEDLAIDFQEFIKFCDSVDIIDTKWRSVE